MPRVADLGRNGRRSAAEEDRAGDAPGRAHLTEARLLVFEFGRLGAVAVDVPLDDGVPASRQVVGQLVAAAAVVQRQAAGQDHQVLVVVLPEAIDDLRHQLQHAARALKPVDGGPVLVEPVEDLRMDRIGLQEPVVVAAFLRLGRQLGALGDIGIGERAADRLAGLRVAHRLEQPPADDLERLFGGDRLPERLHAPEGLLEGPERRDAALAAGLDVRLRQRREHDRVRHELRGLGQGLHEREVAVVGAAAQDLPFRELPDVGHQLVDQNNAGRVAFQKVAQHLLAGRRAGRVGLLDEREGVGSAELPGQLAPKRLDRLLAALPGLRRARGRCRRARRREPAARPSIPRGRSERERQPVQRARILRVARW